MFIINVYYYCYYYYYYYIEELQFLNVSYLAYSCKKFQQIHNANWQWAGLRKLHISCIFRRLPEPNRACLVGVYAFLIWNNLCDLVYQTPTKSYQSQNPRFSTPTRT